jgi:hypothetical protein
VHAFLGGTLYMVAYNFFSWEATSSDRNKLRLDNVAELCGVAYGRSYNSNNHNTTTTHQVTCNGFTFTACVIRRGLYFQMYAHKMVSRVLRYIVLHFNSTKLF